MIERTSRWPEPVPLSSIIAEACAKAFISTWISRFGVQALLTSDRGSQFMSLVWVEVCSILGISRIQTMSFPTLSNIMIDRFHRSLKFSQGKAGRLRLVFSPPSHNAWSLVLPMNDLGFSPREAIFGTPLSLPGEFLGHPEIPPDVFSGVLRVHFLVSLALRNISALQRSLHRSLML